MVTKTYGSALHGINASILTIATSKGQGRGPGFSGLPGGKEMPDRVAASLKALGFKIPRDPIVSVAPDTPATDIVSCDLSLALGMLRSGGQAFPESVEDYIIVGSLSPEGAVRPVRGALLMAIQARKEGFKGIVLPKENASEAAIVNKLAVIGIKNLQETIDFFKRERTIEPVVQDTRDLFYSQLNNYGTDFSDVPGHQNLKRALEIAAAGGHHVIMIGPPGAGKSEIAKRLPTILPSLTLQEALETTKVYSAAGKLGDGASLISRRPCRRLHHTISGAALTGDGSRPGEISLAHNGVLFLDELPEFNPAVPDIIARALKTRKIALTQGGLSEGFPAAFMLIAGMNPCPCGYFNHPDKTCICSPEVMRPYLSKLKGALSGGIDLQVEMTPFDEGNPVASEDIRERVAKAREIQSKRFGHEKNVNAMMGSERVRDACRLSAAGNTLLETAMERSGLPRSSRDPILRISRTIADLSGSEEVKIEHLAEAIRYRSLDKLHAQSLR